jgi:hypothetical protein
MKLVWFSHFVPFPPKGGNLQRSFNLILQECANLGAAICLERHEVVA